MLKANWAETQLLLATILQLYTGMGRLPLNYSMAL